MQDSRAMIAGPLPVSPFILELASGEATLEHVGAKGASLARMAAADLPVPPGFHITTTAYRRFVTASGLQESILGAATGVGPGEPEAAERGSARIRALFEAAVVPDEVSEEIRKAYAGLGRPAVAVRSSATAEDLPEMSFAGQQDTYLNVQGEVELLAAVKRCWASLWTARAISYRARQGIPPDQVSMGVVVQRLVPADAAGVLFTANPVSGDRGQVVINAAWGLGEAIVGGLVTPDTIIADKASGAVISQQIADKTVIVVRAPGGTAEMPVEEALRKVAVLLAQQVRELVSLGRRIEELYGRPIDIEWALHDGRLYILQARPITALPEPDTGVRAWGPPPALDWSLPRPGGRYARASVIELLPDPLSPLFATLALPRWNEAMAEFGEMLGVREAMTAYRLVTINDYAYYDFGFSTKQALQFLAGVAVMARRIVPVMENAEKRWSGEARPAYAGVIRKWELADLRLAPAGHLLEGASDILRAAARHYVALQSGILPMSYMTEMLFTSLYNRLIRRAGDPPALTFLLGSDSTPIRAEKSLYELAAWARGQEALRSYLERTPGAEIASAYCTSTAPGEDLGDAWPEFCWRLADHLARFGHTVYDLDFAKPTPSEDPAPLLNTLKFFIEDQAVSPFDRQATALAARERATKEVLARLTNPRLALFRRTLASAQRYAPLREDALADAGLGWPILRQMLREIGRRLAEQNSLLAADEVFWLQADELHAAATALDKGQGVPDFRPQVARRRATWAAERKVTPPVGLPHGEGLKFLGLDWSSFAPARTDQAQGDTIRGIGTSPGRVTGRARVIHGPEEFGEMTHGDILVAKITTPAWTPLFVLAAGVVTDVGGPLSHGSIVAREYHIPAVLGTGVATERIHTGQTVTVDGDAGTVMIPGASGTATSVVETDRPEARGPRRKWLIQLGLLGAVVLSGLWLFRRQRAANR